MQEINNYSHTATLDAVFSKAISAYDTIMSGGVINIPTPTGVSTTDPILDPLTSWDHTERFLQRFQGVKTFQTFSDKKIDKALARVFHGDDAMGELYAANERGGGVFLCINETDGLGRSSEHITRVRAVFADLDGADIAQCYPHNPHMVVESSPGKFHAYWLCSDVPLDAFRQLQECIATKFGSDPKVKDLPRVMRMPGFIHQKGERFTSRITHEGFHEPFTFAQLTEMFPPQPRKLWVTHHHKNKPVNGDATYKGGYGASKGERNESTMKIVCGMLNRNLPWDYIVDEAHKHGAACCPPMDPNEVESVLQSCRRYGR